MVTAGKAREQVAAHNTAGQTDSGHVADNDGHFINAEKVAAVGFGERTIPDVHLTRFAPVCLPSGV